jgi:hypothetical protein
MKKSTRALLWVLGGAVVVLSVYLDTPQPIVAVLLLVGATI